ncbi:hypothetical protein AHAS_Ahas18G0089200 [Arachis hypogaea]
MGKFITKKEMNLKACKNAIMGIFEKPPGLDISEVEGNKLMFIFEIQDRGK